jgi:riboflavin synthase
VNLEVDQIARYLERLMQHEEEGQPSEGVTLAMLAKAGFMR